MKLQSVGYISQYNNALENNKKKQSPSFGMGNPLVSFATFIENNGFMGEFLTIDTVGMMAPRTAQGYTRNKEELGHLNYKAGREELVRELLSGPAYFYVPLAVLTIAGLLRGKSAKVSQKVLSSFKNIMKNTAGNLKETAALKNNFVNEFKKEAFGDYKNGRDLVERLGELMNQNLNHKLSFKDSILNLFKSKANKKTTASMIRKEAAEVLTRLNKMNGKMIDNSTSVKINGGEYNISNLFKDMANYMDDFSKKASKSNLEKETFIEKFHKTAVKTRDITNVLAISALSAFLMIIPKIYQTDKKFPGTDGLEGTESQNVKEEVKNENK
ncbi:MAG: hypothetical protein KHX03_02960 [Clostridium sp.]|nr:hypothetical protein [Clostridium sp.]